MIFVWGPRIRKVWEASFLFIFNFENFIHAYSLLWYWPHIPPLQFLPYPPPTTPFHSQHHELFHLNPMSPLSAAHTYVHGYRAIYRRWLASQGPCLWEKLIPSPLAAINCQKLSKYAKYHLVFDPVLKKLKSKLLVFSSKTCLF